MVNLWRMPVAFSDLDTYKQPRLQGLSPEALTGCLLRACGDSQLPEPSVVVFSGRGLQAKWLFREPIPQAALPRWTAVQQVLNACLADFGADPLAKDASRVLRLEGTVSSRTGEVIRVTHRARTPTLGGELLSSGVVGYDFDVFADTVLPLSRAELSVLQAQREAGRSLQEVERKAREALLARRTNEDSCQAPRDKRRTPRPLIASQLGWDRLGDLRLLAKMRGYEQGLPPGHRNTFVFLAGCFLAQARLASAFRAEMFQLAREFAPSWTNAEVRSCLSSVVSRLDAVERGETETYQAIKTDLRYRFSNNTLVELLGISGAEGNQLKTILPADESRRRDAARKRGSRTTGGAVSRAQYEQTAAERRTRAREMKARGMSSKDIAITLNVTKDAVNKYLRGGAKKVRPDIWVWRSRRMVSSRVWRLGGVSSEKDLNRASVLPSAEPQLSTNSSASRRGSAIATVGPRARCRPTPLSCKRG